jgi:hypothetical protein
MAPSPAGTAACIASPRSRSSRAASATVNEPTAASAEYSPSECPATNPANSRRPCPDACSTARSAASEVAISAGWALAVRVSVSAGPSKTTAESRSPSASSTSSNTARAAGNASASALPIPGCWAPWPGNTATLSRNDPLPAPAPTMGRRLSRGRPRVKERAGPGAFTET